MPFIWRYHIGQFVVDYQAFPTAQAPDNQYDRIGFILNNFADPTPDDYQYLTAYWAYADFQADYVYLFAGSLFPVAFYDDHPMTPP